jgi:hypothetical protein
MPWQDVAYLDIESQVFAITVGTIAPPGDLFVTIAKSTTRSRSRRASTAVRRWPDDLAATAAEVPENARLFARESLETRENPHKMWKVWTASEQPSIVVND